MRPYVIIDHDPDGTMRVSGFVYQMIKWLAEKYDFKQVYTDNNWKFEFKLKNILYNLEKRFTLLEPSDGLIGTYENGSWSGLVKMLTNAVGYTSCSYLNKNKNKETVPSIFKIITHFTSHFPGSRFVGCTHNPFNCTKQSA